MLAADLLRVFCAAEAVILVAACVYCAVPPMSLDQRVRFAALAVIGFVVVAGQIDGWGKPGNWRMPILAVGLALAVAGSVMFLVKRARSARDDPPRHGT